MKTKSYFREQKKKNDRDAREWDSICRELRKLFPDMSKAGRQLSVSTWGAGMGPQRKLRNRITESGLWETFSLRCRSAEQGLRSWESVTSPLC